MSTVGASTELPKVDCRQFVRRGDDGIGQFILRFACAIAHGYGPGPPLDP